MPRPRTPLGEIAALFLRLGTTAFGGPAAHIAMMEEEVVRRRGWLSREEFLDLVGATNLIPGPNSTELAIHIGHARAGWAGLVVAGLCFIAPAALMAGALAWGYLRFGALPAAGGLLYAVQPVVVAVILQALLGLGRTAIRSRGLALLAALAVIARAAGVNELAVLFGAGALGALARMGATRRAAGAALFPVALTGSAGVGAAPFGLLPLFAVFLKVGAVLFGSGYVLVAFLHSDLVVRLRWLTERQLLDAVAAGQITPGPVFTTATFVGYVLGGAPGAAVATLAIFLPAFAFVALSGPLVPRLRGSRVAAGALDGVNVASLALMAVVTVGLARAAMVDAGTIAIALVSVTLLTRFRVNSVWLMLGAALLGVALGRHGQHL
jgi:chromate transporter